MKSKLFYGWVITGAGLVLSIMGFGARYSFGIFLKALETDFDLSRGATSSVFSLYMLICCFMSILGGWALDRQDTRKVAFAMGSFTGLSLLLTSTVHDLWHLFLTYSLLLSLGTGAIFTVVNTTASRWFVRKRGLVVGITSSGGGLGVIAIAPLAAYLVSNFNWRTAFLVLGSLSWVLMGTASLLLRKDPGDMGLYPDGVEPSPPKDNAHEKRVSRRSAEGLTLKQAAHTSQFWMIAAIWVLLSMTLHMLFVHLVPYAVDMGISPMDAAFILSIIGLANIIGRLIIGRLSDSMDRKRLGTVCAFVQFISFLWLLYAGNLWMFTVFAVVYGFLWGGTSIVVTTLLGDIFGVRSLGIIMGGVNAGWSFGAATGPVLGGVLFDFYGHYTMAFAAGGGAILLATLLLATIRKDLQ